MAIVQRIANRIVIVSLDALNVVVAQQGENPVGMWPKRAHVAKAIDCIHAPLMAVGQCGLESQVVAVESAQTGNARHEKLQVVVSDS